MGKLIEVDEDQYNQSMRLRQRIAAIASDPRRAARLEELEKELDPKVATPALDRQTAENERFSSLEKKIEEFTKGLSDERKKEQEEREKVLREARWEEGRKWMRDRRFTEEGIKKIEDELMIPKGIIDHQDAVKIWEADHPTPPPASPSGGFGAWNFLDPPPAEDKGADNIKKLIESRGENDLVANRMANEALNEFRSQVAQASGRR